MLWRFLCLLVLFCSFLDAQSLGSATSIANGGKIQVQKEGERVWKNVNKKITVTDGDILKTGHKSFIVLQVGESNVIVIGADSRVLINFAPYEGELNLEYTLTATIFEGAGYLN